MIHTVDAQQTGTHALPVDPDQPGRLLFTSELLHARTAGDGSPGYTNHWRNRLNIHRQRIDYVFVGDPFVRTGSGGRVHGKEPSDRRSCDRARQPPEWTA